MKLRLLLLLAGLILGQQMASAQAGTQAWQLLPAEQRSGVTSMVLQLPEGSYTAIDAALENLHRSDTWTLPLPGGDRLELQVVDRLRQGTEVVTIQARGQSGAHAHLTIGPTGLFGHIGSSEGRYQVLSDAAGSWLIHLDDPRIRVDSHCPVEGHAHASTAAGADPRGAGTLDQIDVALLYSPEISERYPGLLLDTRLSHLMAVANQAMVDSQVDIVFRTVHQEEVPTPGSPSIFLALDNMAAGLRGEPADVFTGIDALREEHGADLVIFVWPHDIETRGACGVAFLPEQDEVSGEWIDTRGVHVTNDGISNWSVCSDAVMTHEFGHNLGSVHQRFSPDEAGYNFAHVVPDVLNTVMGSFGSANRNRYLRMSVFSNPDISCGGAPCGSMVPGQEANAALTLNDFSSIVAGYAAPVYPGISDRPAPSNPDSDGDNSDDWTDPFPFDPFNGMAPPPPDPPGFVAPPLFDGSSIEHYELLVASSGSDQVHSWHMDGSWQGRVIQAERLPFPDERPALSEFTRLLVGADGSIYMTASASVRRFDRVSGAEFDVFLDSQPPFSSPGSLTDGFPRTMRFNEDQSQLVVLGNQTVQTYDAVGNLIGFFGGLPLAEDPINATFDVRPRDLAFHPSGKRYVIDDAESRILIFSSSSFEDYTGDLVTGHSLIGDPWAMVMGEDEHLYLANGDNDNVLRISTLDGSVEVLIPAGAGGLDFARDLAFGPDGLLYVLSRGNSAVLRFDPNTGDFVDAFVPAGHPGLDQAQSLAFALRIDADIFRDRFELD
ncbi:zinc-dependent metalloprotease family protein [Wenzhouxiangella marina]|uniref:Uncharacterized protein n=1 Tax=Wenzhouxiangella marina TaxID=1579979 RepID=A0A0K0XZT5_9GAMM|nr:zinc-dependent metalloprotease family protein [Wenzhouxiangella marina]AKS43131.1 hypothetical protein WM2015_2774 [Wenzhouxiangella marina]MBB6087184.1 hypothetical protein [Wenzhouxiangella marina]